MNKKQQLSVLSMSKILGRTKEIYEKALKKIEKKLWRIAQWGKWANRIMWTSLCATVNTQLENNHCKWMNWCGSSLYVNINKFSNCQLKLANYRRCNLVLSCQQQLFLLSTQWSSICNFIFFFTWIRSIYSFCLFAGCSCMLPPYHLFADQIE